MKKKIGAIVFIIVMLSMLTVFATACGGGEYKINFYNGDTLYDTRSTKGKENITIPTAPTKDGYTFGGWYLDKELATELKEDTYASVKLEAEVNVYAKWTANDNTITFDKNGGESVMANQIIKTDANAPLTANAFTKAGYVFGGWATTANGVVAFADKADYKMGVSGVTLFAVWTANDNAITFDKNGGESVMANQIIKTDANAPLTANAFTKAGYTFAGWATTANGVVAFADKADYAMTANGSTTLFAVWTANDNAITFDKNGGENVMVNQIIKTDASAKLTLNAFTRAGYTFAGWATTANATVAEYLDGVDYAMTANGSTTLFAVWTANDNTIMFGKNGGEGVMANQIIKTDATAKLTPNAFTRAGYTFAGWGAPDGTILFADEAEYTMKANDGIMILLVAVWTANDNAIIFDKNGGEGSMSTQIIKTDVTESLKTNTFKKPGYKFLGWAKTADATVAEYANSARYEMKADGTITLYAVWEIDTSGMSFTPNGSNTTLTSCGGSAQTIIVPESYDGRPVTEIGANAFASRPCANIILPSSLLVINAAAFSSCYNLTSVVFQGKSSLTTIKERVFFGCGSLKEFTIPASVTTIENSSLYSVFSGSSITKFIVEDTNTNFRVANDCLIKGNAVIAGCNVKDIVIPSGIITIDGYAFEGRKSIEHITIPASVTTINQGAFKDIKKMKSIVIPSTVVNIDGATDNTFNNTTVYYEGATIPEAWRYSWRNEGTTAVITNCALSTDKTYVESFKRTTENMIEATGEDKTFSAPYRVGYTFDGWFTDNGFQNKVENANLIKQTPGTTLYAKWTRTV